MIYNFEINGSRRSTTSLRADSSISDEIERVMKMPTRYSWLKKMAQSPWDYLCAAANEDEEDTVARKLGAAPGRDKKTAMNFGTAVHHYCLGSEEKVVVFDRAASDQLIPATKGKVAAKRVVRAGNAWDAFRLAHEALGETILTEKEAMDARSMANMIRGSEKAMALLFDDTIVEQRIDWNLQGRAIRSTPDSRRPGDIVVDLKSCVDNSPGKFVPQIYRMLYHAQLATYVRAAEEIDGIAPKEAWIVAIDRKHPPRCYRIPEQGLQLGHECLGRWIEILKTCEASLAFPFDEIHDADPPSYLISSDGEEEYGAEDSEEKELDQGDFQ